MQCMRKKKRLRKLSVFVGYDTCNADGRAIEDANEA
jgi:hypothetical protein